MKRKRVLGCDISKYQYQWTGGNTYGGTIDWLKMKSAGAEFVIIKASDGMYNDPCFARSWAGAKTILPRGAYHYFRPEVKTSTQINIFLTTLNGDWGEEPPALDIEKNANAIGITAFRVGIRLWLQEIEKATGFIPRIYTRQSFWDPQIGAYNVARMYPFWLAYYNSYDLLPPVPLECHNIAMHQFSADKNNRGAEFGVLSHDIDLDWKFVEY